MLEVVCGVIQEKSGRILACQRSRERHLGGLWEFPGGKVELGEAPRTALARELAEELSIVVDVGDKLDAEVDWADATAHIRLTAYYCKIISGIPEALEHEEIRWFKPEELSNLTWAEADHPILAEFLSKQESLRFF